MGFIESASEVIYWIWWFISWFWWAIMLTIMFVWRSRLRKYPINAVIYEKRGDNVINSNDRLGRFEDFGVVKYRFKMSKDTVPVMDYDWILHNAAVSTNLFEKIINLLQGSVGTATLYKYGSKQYKPIRVRLGIVKRAVNVISGKGFQKEVELKEKKEVQNYAPINMAKQLEGLEFDVVDWDNMNFMVQEHRATLDRRKSRQDWISKWGPTIGLGFVALVFILAMYFAVGLINDAASMKMGQAAQAAQKAAGANVPIIGDIFTPGK